MISAERLGILGGTFDPVHAGHIAVAQAARHALGLRQVCLMPSRVPAHRHGPQASAYHRFAMVAMAALSVEGLIASDADLDTPGPSYTIELLERLHAEGHQPSQIVFITGADAFADIASWRRYPALLDAAHFAVVSRPRQRVQELCERLPELSERFVLAERPDARARLEGPQPAVFLIDAPTPDVSSTNIRERLQMGTSIAGLVPADVERYIRRHRLYAAEIPTAGHLHEHTAQ
jgi:nicotinate-nucleotide adenylyltransferase